MEATTTANNGEGQKCILFRASRLPGKCILINSEEFCRKGRQVQFALYACFAQVQDLRPREEGGRALSVSKPLWQDTDIVSDYIVE